MGLDKFPDVKVTKATYIVAVLPDTVASWVRLTRITFEPAIAHMPAEITIAGSSGVGPLKEGQEMTFVEEKLKAALRGQLPFESRFEKIGRFPGTDIFFASPEVGKFTELHSLVAASGVQFEANPFPYSPHCSLKGYTRLLPGQRNAIEALKIPTEPFVVSELAVYEMAGMQPKKLLSITG